MYYVFDIDKYINWLLSKSFYKINTIRADYFFFRKLNGKLVDFDKELWGNCDGFRVRKEWCREVGYVMKFSKELYLKSSKYCDKWCELVDGKIVEFKDENSTCGRCEDFIILKDWCKEITF